jgi:predicted SprT family Zn-dependent metalloprotease
MEFSRQFLELGDESAIMDVIRHELAHAFVFMETGRKHGHDYVFKAMCLRIGTRLDMAESDVGYRVPAEEINKYTIRCSECGKIVGYRQRMCPVVKTPENFQSSCCHADLVVTQNF